MAHIQLGLDNEVTRLQIMGWAQNWTGWLQPSECYSRLENYRGTPQISEGDSSMRARLSSLFYKTLKFSRFARSFPKISSDFLKANILLQPRLPNHLPRMNLPAADEPTRHGPSSLFEALASPMSFLVYHKIYHASPKVSITVMPHFHGEIIISSAMLLVICTEHLRHLYTFSKRWFLSNLVSDHNIHNINNICYIGHVKINCIINNIRNMPRYHKSTLLEGIRITEKKNTNLPGRYRYKRGRIWQLLHGPQSTGLQLTVKCSPRSF